MRYAGNRRRRLAAQHNLPSLQPQQQADRLVLAGNCVRLTFYISSVNNDSYFSLYVKPITRSEHVCCNLLREHVECQSVVLQS